MPFYEYECSNCKFYVEVLQKISDEPLRDCPSCKKPQLKKLVSAPVFRLKGAGWYETDFKGDNEGKRNLADREEPAGASEDSSAKPASDSKVEKADTKSVSKPEVSSVSGKKAAPAGKAESKARPKAPAKPSKPAKAPSKPAKKSAPAKKKAAKRR